MQSGFSKNLRSLKRRSFLGQLVVTLLSCELLFFASFVSLSLPTPTSRNLERYVHNTAVDFVNQLPSKWQERIREKLPATRDRMPDVRFSSYVPLLPVAMAVAYMLGLPLALIASSIYFGLGMLGANSGLFLFASGGGSSYCHEPGFGYLLGIIPGVWFASWLTSDEERKSWKQMLAATGGITITHICGLAYFFGSSIMVLLFEGEAAYLHYQPWLAEQIRNLSWYTLPYDLLFATILIALTFPLRWLFGILMSPDIANKNRPTVETQLEVLQETSY